MATDVMIELKRKKVIVSAAAGINITLGSVFRNGFCKFGGFSAIYTQLYNSAPQTILEELKTTL